MARRTPRLTSVKRQVSVIHRSLRLLDRALADFRGRYPRLRPEPSATVATAGRGSPNLSTAGRAALKLQGQDMGHMRQLKAAQKAMVRAVEGEEWDKGCDQVGTDAEREAEDGVITTSPIFLPAECARVQRGEVEENMITEDEGIKTLCEVVEVVDAENLRYWLGRGLFRHYTLNKSFGDRQGDIDFHVLRDDEKRLRAVVTELENRGFRIVSGPEHRHKVSIKKGAVEVEFVFLERDGEDLWHQAGWPQLRRFTCPSAMFGDRREEMFGVSVRVPEDGYLEAVYGPEWTKNRKGSGGTLMR